MAVLIPPGASLGLIILELAANIELPSQGDSWQSLRNGYFNGIIFEPDMSAPLIALIFQMLHPDPSQRATIDYVIASSSP